LSLKINLQNKAVYYDFYQDKKYISKSINDTDRHLAIPSKVIPFFPKKHPTACSVLIIYYSLLLLGKEEKTNENIKETFA
jgi:hypothetical protein